MSLDLALDLPRVHLSPGELLFASEPQIVATVLGYCVSVTMFDRRSALAAICHAMLAEPGPAEIPAPGLLLRYVSHAVPAMIDRFHRAGVDWRHVDIKVFGGANVLGHDGTAADEPHWIGGANIAAVHRCLQRARLAVAAENTGGRCGRKILFNTGSGEVLHKHLQRYRA